MHPHNAEPALCCAAAPHGRRHPGCRSRGLLRPGETRAGRTTSVELELLTLDVCLFHSLAVSAACGCCGWPSCATRAGPPREEARLARAPLPRYQLYSGTTSAKSTKSGFHGGVLRQPGRPIGPREAQEIEIGSIESDEKRPKFFRRHSPSHGSRIRLNGRFVSSPLAVEGQAQHRVEDCSLHNR